MKKHRWDLGQMRNGETFKRIISRFWMRSIIIWRILQIEVSVVHLIGIIYIHAKAS